MWANTVSAFFFSKLNAFQEDIPSLEPRICCQVFYRPIQITAVGGIGVVTIFSQVDLNCGYIPVEKKIKP